MGPAVTTFYKWLASLIFEHNGNITLNFTLDEMPLQFFFHYVLMRGAHFTYYHPICNCLDSGHIDLALAERNLLQALLLVLFIVVKIINIIISIITVINCSCPAFFFTCNVLSLFCT